MLTGLQSDFSFKHTLEQFERQICSQNFYKVRSAISILLSYIHDCAFTMDPGWAANIVVRSNVAVGLRVRRNSAHWRNKKWRDDKRGPGTVIGYTNADGVLVGGNSERQYDTDRITHTSGPDWAVVRWDNTGKASVYPVGAEGPLGGWWPGGPCYALCVDTNAS